MQTFATLTAMLARIQTPLRFEPDVMTVDLEGHAVELRRILADDVEWAAISVVIGVASPASNDGLGAIVRCPQGWALRLTLPIAELAPKTVAAAMLRLAREVVIIQRDRIPPADRRALHMWVD